MLAATNSRRFLKNALFQTHKRAVERPHLIRIVSRRYGCSMTPLKVLHVFSILRSYYQKTQESPP